MTVTLNGKGILKELKKNQGDYKEKIISLEITNLLESQWISLTND